MGSRVRHAALMASLSFVLASSAFAADPTAADKETARALMATGRSKRDAGDLKGALQAFQAADSLMHYPTTAFEVAKTEAALGMLLDARDVALAVARSAPKPGEQPALAEARKNADALATELGERIPSISVKVSPAAVTDLHVIIDGTELPAAAATLPRKVDPGQHRVVARGNGKETSAQISVAERETKEVPLDLDSPAATAPTAEGTSGSSGSAPSAPPATDAGPSTGPRPGTVLAIGGFGIGVIGLGLGVVTGAMSLSQTSSLKSQCPNNQCPASLSGKVDTARTLATLADVGLVVGGVGVAVGVAGVVMLVTGNKSTTAAIQPYFSGTSAGLYGRF